MTFIVIHCQIRFHVREFFAEVGFARSGGFFGPSKPGPEQNGRDLKYCFAGPRENSNRENFRVSGNRRYLWGLQYFLPCEML